MTRHNFESWRQTLSAFELDLFMNCGIKIISFIVRRYIVLILYRDNMLLYMNVIPFHVELFFFNCKTCYLTISLGIPSTVYEIYFRTHQENRLIILMKYHRLLFLF